MRSEFSPDRGRRSGLLKLVLVVIIVGAIGFYFLTGNSGSIRVLSSNATVSLQNGQSAYFRFPGSSDTYSMLVLNSNTSGATIYISKLPVLTTPIVAFSSSIGVPINVSASGGSKANVQVKIVASGTNAAQVMLTPIPTSFSIKVSPNVRLISPASFTTQNNSTTSLLVSTSTTTTATTSTTSTTTVPTTTTVTQNPALATAIVSANNTYIGALMVKYNALYQKDQACTQGSYNSTYLTYRSQVAILASYPQPTGPFSYANVSAATPSSLTANAVQVSTNVYTINYVATTSNKALSGVAVTAAYNTSSGVITPSYKGIYQGQNYTTLTNNYNFQNGITGSCGAYIP